VFIYIQRYVYNVEITNWNEHIGLWTLYLRGFGRANVEVKKLSIANLLLVSGVNLYLNCLLVF